MFDFVFSFANLDMILLAVVAACFYFALDARHTNREYATCRGPVNPIGDGDRDRDRDGSKPAPSRRSGEGNRGNHGRRGRGRGANPHRGCPCCHLE